MKKMILLIIIIFLGGCSLNKNTLFCTLNEATFEKGTMDIEMTFTIDENKNITTSEKIQYIHFNNKEDAKTFYEQNKSNSVLVSETEIKYEITEDINEVIKINEIKERLDLESYTCVYKK